jgi:hypothetical protein
MQGPRGAVHARRGPRPTNAKRPRPHPRLRSQLSRRGRRRAAPESGALGPPAPLGDGPPAPLHHRRRQKAPAGCSEAGGKDSRPRLHRLWVRSVSARGRLRGGPDSVDFFVWSGWLVGSHLALGRGATLGRGQHQACGLPTHTLTPGRPPTPEAPVSGNPPAVPHQPRRQHRQQARTGLATLDRAGAWRCTSDMGCPPPTAGGPTQAQLSHHGEACPAGEERRPLLQPSSASSSASLSRSLSGAAGWGRGSGGGGNGGEGGRGGEIRDSWRRTVPSGRCRRCDPAHRTGRPPRGAPLLAADSAHTAATSGAAGSSLAVAGPGNGGAADDRRFELLSKARPSCGPRPGRSWGPRPPILLPPP